MLLQNNAFVIYDNEEAFPPQSSIRARNQIQRHPIRIAASSTQTDKKQINLPLAREADPFTNPATAGSLKDTMRVPFRLIRDTVDLWRSQERSARHFSKAYGWLIHHANGGLQARHTPRRGQTAVD